ncbi:hypothetical protein AMAG_06421 [Allomyces macrogynus ATCC 38327]|uniref:ATP-dependent helicase HrpA n=1 Tax=Allomyces macrogynus (strain ATCC 38327) TaxID=578462 RepID=A0A0L0SGG7_ALLM3|nr:hypothetical protein AMAG_06421 [Allomyces macrogynus ATCC 38327]|eukprot:KNE61608.1 hypothetical protein AMAG_06421 [Allomyces macrogynus ATCC 38327]
MIGAASSSFTGTNGTYDAHRGGFRGRGAPRGRGRGGRGGRSGRGGQNGMRTVVDSKRRAAYEQGRDTLPITRHRDEILRAIASSPITIITGGTGCGKSTQVPQYLYQQALEKRTECKIVCTQPRRLATITLARRVAAELGVPAGQPHDELVGFQIGGLKYARDDTKIRFMTTGVLLESLRKAPDFGNCTHLIIDEVHERNLDEDLLQYYVRYVLQRNTELKIIIMSATIDTKTFLQYYQPLVPRFRIPVIEVAARTFPVTVQYWHDVLRELRLISFMTESPQLGKPGLFDATNETIIKHIIFRHQSDPMWHSYLVFLPGLGSIEEFAAKIQDLADRVPIDMRRNVDIIKLHSTIDLDDQTRIVQRPPKRTRKIILATNIAETSLTIPDAMVVFDTCLRKDVVYQDAERYASLNEVWVSQSCADQRKGRVGRVRAGTVYRYVPDALYQQLRPHREPEMRRLPLQTVVLRVLAANMTQLPKKVLEQCLSPPNLENVQWAIDSLLELQCIEPVVEPCAAGASDALLASNGQQTQGDRPYTVTSMGRVVADLPLEPEHGILCLLGHAMGVLDDCMLLACILQRRGVILTPPSLPVENAAAMLSYAVHIDEKTAGFGGSSDLLAHLNAYRFWEHAHRTDAVDPDHEPEWCRDEQHLSLYWLREVQDLVITLRKALAKHKLAEMPSREEMREIRRKRTRKVRELDKVEFMDEFDDDFEANQPRTAEQAEADEVDGSELILEDYYQEEEAQLLDPPPPTSVSVIDDLLEEFADIPTVSDEKLVDVVAQAYKAQQVQAPTSRPALDQMGTVANPFASLLRTIPNRVDRPELLCLLLAATQLPNRVEHTPGSKFPARIPNNPRLVPHATVEVRLQHPLRDIPSEHEQTLRRMGMTIKARPDLIVQLMTQQRTQSVYLTFRNTGKWMHAWDPRSATPRPADGVYLAHKLRPHNGQRMFIDAHRDYAVTRTLPYQRGSGAAQVYVGRASLYTPLLLPSGGFARPFSVTAADLRAVNYGRAWNVAHLTALFPAVATRVGVQAILEACFAPRSGTRSAVINGSLVTLVRLSADQSAAVDAFRAFVRDHVVHRAMYVTNALQFEEFDEDGNAVAPVDPTTAAGATERGPLLVENVRTMRDVAEAWTHPEIETKAAVAGALLVKMVGMLVREMATV